MNIRPSAKVAFECTRVHEVQNNEQTVLDVFYTKVIKIGQNLIYAIKESTAPATTDFH
jgi:hypothetical protein